MKIVARALAGIGVIAIVVAGFAVAFLLEFDFVVTDLPLIITFIVGGIVVGLVLIAIAAVIGAKYKVVTFSGFRAGQPGAVIDFTPEEKP